MTMPITDKVFDDEIYNALNLVGDVLGKQERSQEVVDYMKSVAEELKSRTENIPKDKIPTAYCGAVSFKGAHGIEGTEAGYPPFSALGITNVADETGKKGAFDVDLEQILKWNSDYLFLDAGNLKLVNDDYAVRPGGFGHQTQFGFLHGIGSHGQKLETHTTSYGTNGHAIYHLVE